MQPTRSIARLKPMAGMRKARLPMSLWQKLGQKLNLVDDPRPCLLQLCLPLPSARQAW